MTLEEIQIPDTVTDIGTNAFWGCRMLKTISLPDSLQHIESNTFNHCESLTEISFPQNVRSIGYSAFGNCTNLTSVVLPETTENVDIAAFGYCSNLVTLESPISTSWTYSDNRTYGTDLMPKLNSFIFTGGTGIGIDYDGGDANSYRKLPWYLNRALEDFTIKFKDGITRIGDYTFANQNIENYVLPATLQEIGDNAFYRNKNLADINLPEGLLKIGYEAFADCESLMEITLPASLENMKKSSFENNDELIATVYEDTYGHEAAVKYGIPYRLSENGPVVTPPEEAAPTGSIQIGTAYTKAGYEVKVPVDLAMNPGIVALKLGMDFDRNALELVAVENGDIFADDKLNVDANLADATTLFWSDAQASANTEAAGRLAVLTFRVKDAAADGTYAVRLTCSSIDGAYAYDGSKVGFNAAAGAVQVNPFFYGDISGDDIINMLDVTYTKYHIADYVAYRDLLPDPADVDLKDGVTARDLMILERYLAKWTGYDSLPDTREKLA